jgi:hypothetical protein
MTAPPASRASLTLVMGGSAAQREAAIAARLAAEADDAGAGAGINASAGIDATGAGIRGASAVIDRASAGIGAANARISPGIAVSGASVHPRALVSAVLLEGLPSGHTLLESSDRLHLHRIAPGCLCCTGNLVLRVTLNRILRLRPDRLFIGLAATDHLDQLRSWLQHPPYDQLLELTADLHT